MCKFGGRGICFKRDIQPRGISAKVPRAVPFVYGSKLVILDELPLTLQSLWMLC